MYKTRLLLHLFLYNRVPVNCFCILYQLFPPISDCIRQFIVDRCVLLVHYSNAVPIKPFFSFLFIALLFYSPPVFFSIYQTNLPLVLVYTVVHILQIRIHIPWESLTPLRHICIYLNKASFYFNRSTWKLTRNRRLNLKFEIHVPNCLKEEWNKRRKKWNWKWRNVSKGRMGESVW